MISPYPFVVAITAPFKEKNILFYFTRKYPCHLIITYMKKQRRTKFMKENNI